MLREHNATCKSLAPSTLSYIVEISVYYSAFYAFLTQSVRAISRPFSPGNDPTRADRTFTHSASILADALRARRTAGRALILPSLSRARLLFVRAAA
jgi:hypothetical protein